MARVRNYCAALGLSALGACGRCGGEEGLAAPAASTAPADAGPPEAPAPVPDLDLEELGGRLGCAGAKGEDGLALACGVLARMGQCGPFEAPRLSAGEEAHWAGRGARLEGGRLDAGGAPRPEAVVEAVVLRVRPAAEPLPGHLPLRFGLFRRPESPGDPLLGKTPEKVLEAIESLPAFGEVAATRTARGRAYLIAERGGHLCRAPGGELFLVLRRASRISPEDGLYATLRPLGLRGGGVGGEMGGGAGGLLGNGAP